jgi:hypothetical protein
MEMAFWSVCHKSEQVRISAYRGLKNFSKSTDSKEHIRKLRAKIKRKFEDQYTLTNIFNNASCFDAFLKWYESSSITFDLYKEMICLQRYPKFKTDESIINNPIDEWCLASNGYLH